MWLKSEIVVVKNTDVESESRNWIDCILGQCFEVTLLAAKNIEKTFDNDLELCQCGVDLMPDEQKMNNENWHTEHEMMQEKMVQQMQKEQSCQKIETDTI